MRGIIVGTLCVLAACGDDPGRAEPEITGASVTTDEDAPIIHTVAARDPQGRALALEAQPPMHGTVAVDRLSVTYTPSPDYHGPDAFTVTVTNGTFQASARIDVMVRPVNDAPEAGADAFAATEDTPLVRSQAALLANDTDVDGDTLTVTEVGDATNGTVAMAGADITFTPAPDFSGMASYQYTVSDGTVTATATVTIMVGGVNDAPVAAGDLATTPEDTSVAVTEEELVANDTDPEGQTLTVTAVGNATHGTVELAGGVATFTPDADFNGTATFEYTVSDGAATATGVVTVTIDPVNDPPVAVDDTAATEEDTPLVIAAATLLANDTDVDGPMLAVIAVQAAANGTAVLDAGSITFTPAPGFTGTAVFEYVVGDGAATDVGAVAVTVAPAASCGDGVLQAGSGEECDDGNTAPGDGCSASCELEELSVFTFTGAAGDEPTFPADFAAPGLAAIPEMSRGPGLAVAAAANEFSSEVWQLGPTLDPTDYYAFTVTPAAGAALTLLAIELDERRSASGPLFWALRSSLDGFTTDIAMFALPDDTSFRRDQRIPLGPELANLTAPVELRIYGWDAEGSLGTWRLDNVEVYGFTAGP